MSDDTQNSKSRKATVKEMAAILRSTEAMASEFAQRVQERGGKPVAYTEILTAMQDMSAKRLSMGKVVSKVRRQLESG
jgi:hypothetical protein